MNIYLKSLLRGLQQIVKEKVNKIKPDLEVPLEDVAKFDLTKIVNFENEEQYTDKFKEMIEKFGDKSS